MSVYVIMNIDVKDPTPYEEYKAKVPALIRKHGGEYLVLGSRWKLCRCRGRLETQPPCHASFP